MTATVRRSDWRRVAAYIVEARSRLYGTQERWAAASGLSTRIIYDLEKGARESYRPAIIATAERSLHWLPGSVEEILDGGEPILAPAPPAGTTVERVSDQEWLAAGQGLTDAQRAALMDAIRKLLDSQ